MPRPARCWPTFWTMDDFGSEIRIAALLGALAVRGETEDELAGFVDTIRARGTQLPLDRC